MAAAEPPTGQLVLVATPIGNLGDLSPRAVATLAAADLLCCEDTRRTRALLAHAGVRGCRLVAVHRHNERQQAPMVVDRLRAGQTVAVVTDAGTPGISDPGAVLVAAAAEAGMAVSVVPGPDAATAALVVSGMVADRWCFEGFLPRRGPERRQRLAAMAAGDRPTIVYEAPSRVAATLADVAAACGDDRPVAVVRELTKQHEEVWRGTASAAAAELAARHADQGVRGELVLVVGGAPGQVAEPTDHQVAEVVARHRAAGCSARDAAAAAAAELGVSRRRAYQLAVGAPADDRDQAAAVGRPPGGGAPVGNSDAGAGVGDSDGDKEA